MKIKLLCLGVQDVIPPNDGDKEGIHGALAALARTADVTYAYPARTDNPDPAAGCSECGVAWPDGSIAGAFQSSYSAERSESAAVL